MLSPPAENLKSPQATMPKEQRTLASFFQVSKPAKRKGTEEPGESAEEDKDDGGQEPAPAARLQKRRNVVESDSEEDDDETIRAAMTGVPSKQPDVGSTQSEPLGRPSAPAHTKRPAPASAAAPGNSSSPSEVASKQAFSIFTKPTKKAKETEPAAAPAAPAAAKTSPPVKVEAVTKPPAIEASPVAANASAAAAVKREAMPYRKLSKCLDDIDSTTKRLDITKFAREFIREVIRTSPQSLLQCMYLCINKLGPDHDNIELGVGDSILIKAIAQSSGRKPDKIKQEYGAAGDLGDIAMQAKGKQGTLSFGAKPKPLTVPQVFGALRDIADCSGSGSQQTRVDIIKKLLVAGVSTEPKFIIRHCQGKLRIGMSDKTLLVAAAHAFALSPIGPDGVGVDLEFKTSVCLTFRAIEPPSHKPPASVLR